MAQKVFQVVDSDKQPLGYAFYCEGCGNYHMYYTEKPNDIGAKWTFNGDLDRPTFRASMLIRMNKEQDNVDLVCHSFVTDGKIQYLNDCTHHLKGQTIEMKDIETD